MDTGSLVTQQIEASNTFLAEFERVVPVCLAFWIKEREEGPWKLYVVSEQFDKSTRREAYGDVLRIVREMNDPLFVPFQVKLIGARDPLAQAVLEFSQRHPPYVPLRLGGQSLGGSEAEEIYLLKEPSGEHPMAGGREVLHQIIDQEAAFFQQHGKQPQKIKLPVLMAYDLAKCGREDLGELSGKVFKDGITAFETEGFHGMAVEIVRTPDAVLEFE